MRATVRILIMTAVLAMACDAAEESTPEESAPANQRFEVNVGAHGYDPSTLQVPVGQPVTLVVTRTTEEGCGDVLAIPSQDIRRDLPLNEPVEISFTPTAAGTVRFTCGMDMYDGTIVVQ